MNDINMSYIIRYSEPFFLQNSDLCLNRSGMLSFKYFFFFFSLVCADLIRGAKEKSLKVKGPVRMPTKVNTRLDFFFYFFFFLGLLISKQMEVSKDFN